MKMQQSIRGSQQRALSARPAVRVGGSRRALQVHNAVKEVGIIEVACAVDPCTRLILVRWKVDHESHRSVPIAGFHAR